MKTQFIRSCLISLAFVTTALHASETGWTLLHEAVEENDIERVHKILATEEINVNAVDECLWTPLHLAALYGFFECVEELLAHGANLCAQSRKGGTPEEFARTGGFPDLALYLKNKRNDVRP